MPESTGEERATQECAAPQKEFEKSTLLPAAFSVMFTVTPLATVAVAAFTVEIALVELLMSGVTSRALDSRLSVFEKVNPPGDGANVP